jgi:hypothetical protein
MALYFNYSRLTKTEGDPNLMQRLPIFILFCTSVGCALGATASVVLVDNSPKRVDGITQYVEAAHGTIKSPREARNLIDLVLKTGEFAYDADPAKTKTDNAGFYCIIHTVVWEKPDDTATPGGDTQLAQKVKEQHWYLYSGSNKWTLDEFTTTKRIYGARNVALVYVYLDKATTALFQPRYEIDITSKEPANIQHLFALAAAYLPAPQQAATEKISVTNYGGMANFDVRYVPSDISVTPFIMQGDPDRPAETMRTGVGDSVVFDDEGYYYWDASVGIPIRKMGQLEFQNVNNTITAKEPDKRTAFALLDLYPFKKDVKAQGSDWRPYAVAGVGIGKQPLHRILVGMGWGPKFAQFYVGAMFTKEQELKGLAVGASATPQQQASATGVRYDPKFAFGINLPVRDVFKAASGSNSGGNPSAKTNGNGKQ